MDEPKPKPRFDEDGHRLVEPPPRRDDERVDVPPPQKRMGISVKVVPFEECIAGVRALMEAGVLIIHDDIDAPPKVPYDQSAASVRLQGSIRLTTIQVSIEA